MGSDGPDRGHGSGAISSHAAVCPPSLTVRVEEGANPVRYRRPADATGRYQDLHSLATIRERNASLYCANQSSTSPPLLLYTQPIHTGRATTILTHGVSRCGVFTCKSG
jgi:hypothetical protein